MNQLQPSVLLSLLHTVNPHSMELEMSEATYHKLVGNNEAAKQRIAFVPVMLNDSLEEGIVNCITRVIPNAVKRSYSIQIV